MDNVIKIKTKFNKDLIQSSVEFPELHTMKDAISQVIDLREEQVRDALIELGWTPPKD